MIHARASGQPASHAAQHATADQADSPAPAGQDLEVAMATAMRVCSRPGCPEITTGGRCPDCSSRAEQQRGSAAVRGYGASWARRRIGYLTAHPICVIDGAIATVADHHPVSRRDLVADGVPDPDADHRLRALCATCHGRETAEHQPGGWNAR